MLVPTQQRWERVAASRKKVGFFLLVIMHKKNWSLAKALAAHVLGECAAVRPSKLLSLLKCTSIKLQWEKSEVKLFKKGVDTVTSGSLVPHLLSTDCYLRVGDLRLRTVAQNPVAFHSLSHDHRNMHTLFVCGVFPVFLDIKWLACCFWRDCAASGDVWLFWASAPTLLMSRLLSGEY